MSDGGSIIDRIVTSSGSFIDSEILVADGHHDYVPMTDHRAIVGRLVLKPPGRNSARCLHEVSNPILNTPRIKFPNSNDKHLFQAYHDLTNTQIKTTGLHDQIVTDHLNSLYRNLTNIINKSAEEVFGRIKRKQPNTHKIITNPLIQQLIGQSRAIGGAIRIDKNPSHPASRSAKNTYLLFLSEYSLNTTDHISLRSLLIDKRKSVNKELYHEKSNEIYTRAKRYDAFRITQALNGGSTKRLVHAAEFIPLPMSVNTIDGSGKLLTDPDQVKAETRHYWEKLYAHQPIPVMEKPWLSTKSVKEVHHRVSANPFIWPS